MEYEHIKSLVEDIKKNDTETIYGLEVLEERLKKLNIKNVIELSHKLEGLIACDNWFKKNGGIFKVNHIIENANEYKELIGLLIEDLGVNVTLKTEKNYYDIDEWDIDYYADFNGLGYHLISSEVYDCLKDYGVEKEKED